MSRGAQRTRLRRMTLMEYFVLGYSMKLEYDSLGAIEVEDCYCVKKAEDAPSVEGGFPPKPPPPRPISWIGH